MINWNTTKEDGEIIEQIAHRAVAAYKSCGIGKGYDQLQATMDITACHLNGNPLRLKDLLRADDFNFMHDISGIRNTINRETGALEKGFRPRYSKPAVMSGKS